MGRDKALVELAGSPLGRRAADALRVALGAPPLLVGATADHAAALDGAAEADLWPGEGPVGGLITAMHSAFVRGARHVVVVACDLPALTAGAVGALAAAARDAGPAVATIVTVDGRRAYPNGVWPVRLLPAIEDRFTQGADGFGEALGGVDVVEHAGGEEWRDADTPGELDRFR